MQTTAAHTVHTGGWDAQRMPADHRALANILGTGVDAVDMDEALSIIFRHLRESRKGYVCEIGVHGVLEALRDQALADTFAGAVLNVPACTPTVWAGRLQGFKWMDHVTGPALMREIFSRREFARYSHYFYGGEPGAAAEFAAAMTRQFPWIRIAGTFAPPLSDLSEKEEENLVAEINALHPDMVWVGIGTPRQEQWIRRMLPVVHTRLMFGVGEAFDLHSGRTRDRAPWTKSVGMQWLHRLIHDRKRFWRRSVRNMAFLPLIALQLSGARRYPLKLEPAHDIAAGR